MKKKNLATALAVILLLTGCNQTTASETLDTQQSIQRIENGLPVMTAIGLLLGEERLGARRNIKLNWAERKHGPSRNTKSVA